MSDTTAVPLGIRLLHAVRKQPDWLTMPADELIAFRDAENRRRASALMRVITGFPDRGASISWQEVALPDRVVKVRVYRPSRPAGLPLVLHMHGGGFVGTAVQSDWINSHLAAQLPAVVVSVEHRLVDPETPMSAAVDDDWDVLQHVLRNAEQWGVDPTRTALFGESFGSLVSALTTIRARESGVPLRAQVLVNPCVDVTPMAFDSVSMTEYADSPTLTMPQLELFLRMAVPQGTEPRTLSPLYADDLSNLPPALVVVPTLDPLADQGHAYVDRLRAAGTPVQLSNHPGAGHGFLSMPGLVPHAKAARVRVTSFLRDHLAPG